ncbi:MAG: LamG domain-containing protein [Thermoproteota archaeon]
MRDVRVYYHPSVGDYARLPSFELDYGLAGAGVGGLAAGAGSYALRKADGGSLLWGLAGALIGGAIGGALVPKRILSWFNPPPFDAPIRYPRQIPKVVVPSFIGDAGQVLNLLMHEGAGDTVKDYSGLGNHGKIYGASWVDGPYGWALSFNGVNNYVQVPYSPSLDITDAITILFWIYPRQYKEQYVVTKGYNRYRAGFNPAGQTDALYPNFFLTLSTGSFSLTGSPFTGLNTWHRIGMVYDGSAMKIYRNGALDKTLTGVSGTILTDANPLNVGCYYPPRYYTNGILCLVRIYERALSDAEMKYDFESTRAIFGV